MTEKERERFRNQTAFSAAEGQRWADEKAAEFEALPMGTIVMINVVNGEYVTADDRLQAIDKFHQKFGRHTTLSFSFEIGRPVIIGGGLLALAGL